MHSRSLPFAFALALCGCASVAPPAPPVPSPPPSADQRAAAPAALAAERQWLQSWFQGTPVLIAQRNDGAVTIDVPREFCFDPGRSAVKPALAAVLDKVAESLRRTPAARLPLLAAPDDDGGTTPLALQRAVQMQKHLQSRGVPLARLGKPAATTAAAVQLRMEAPPP
jgi:outer membrane protein OmpA-like peptidoglycan-associated protein